MKLSMIPVAMLVAMLGLTACQEEEAEADDTEMEMEEVEEEDN